MLSNLPLQVVVYFNGWYVVLWELIMLSLFVWKSTALPYPGPLAQLLALEVCLVVLTGLIEYFRLKLASQGNKTERSGPLIFSMLLSFPSAGLLIYFLFSQVYVTRFDLILSATGLGFIALEMLISLLVVLTFSTRARDPAPRPAQTRRQETLARPLRPRADTHALPAFAPAVKAPPSATS